jgi:hypothetical protein
VKALILLADAAQAVDGKLYILGGGWSVTGPEPTPSAIAMKIEVPWDRANHKYNLLLELVDADGQPVMVPSPEGGEQSVQIGALFEAGRPAGLTPGTPLDGAFAINLGPLPLEPGQRYAWRLTVDGEMDEDWQVGFTVRPRVE